jgi:hypothetical protein
MKGPVLRKGSVWFRERYETQSQFLERNARISSFQRVRWNTRARTAEELLASTTSQDYQLKSRDNSLPALAANIVPKDSTFCCGCGCCQCLDLSFASQTINGD